MLAEQLIEPHCRRNGRILVQVTDLDRVLSRAAIDRLHLTAADQGYLVPDRWIVGDATPERSVPIGRNLTDQVDLGGRPTGFVDMTPLASGKLGDGADQIGGVGADADEPADRRLDLPRGKTWPMICRADPSSSAAALVLDTSIVWKPPATADDNFEALKPLGSLCLYF